MAELEDYSPHDAPRTRGDWICEQLKMWEQLESDLRRRLDMAITHEALILAKVRIEELVIAQKVLKNSYFAEELLDFESLTKEGDGKEQIN